MPKAELPTTMRGWIVAIGAGVVGFLAGFVFISIMSQVWR